MSTVVRSGSRWASLALAPESWRRDLLRIVLRACAAFGAIIYFPSVYFALKSGLVHVAVVDTGAIGALLALTYFDRLPARTRAACTCLVLYVLGAWLMVGIGSISMIYLLGFSLLTTLVLSLRWGLASVALNAATMLAVGYSGRAAPEMAVPNWRGSFAEWTVITSNFVLVNASLVLALGAVIAALEKALARVVAEMCERARTDDSLRENRALLKIAGLTARLGGWRVELSGDKVGWSDEVCELHEVPAGTSPTLAEALAFYAPESRDLIADVVGHCGRDGTPFDVEAEILTAKRTRLWVRVIGNAHRDVAGFITHVHGSVQDITSQKLANARHAKLEDQFRQAQKMETIGGLAAGIAHDFNNLLSVILSYSELLAEEMEDGDRRRTDLGEIQAAGNRAVALTRQLLAFSRQQVLAPKVVDLASIVSGMEKMLGRLIGEDVDLVTSCAQGLGKILVDPGQLEQVIMNLAVNARDAMPLGGMLTIASSEIFLDADYASEHVGVSPGLHLMLSVSDTGVGMDGATQARMFEPFFTTKDKDKGTGLGLATVLGIVQQSGGTIWVYSEVGKGTSFKVYFPIVEGSAAPLVAAPVERGMRGAETVLLVEDEAGVRGLARTILRKYGYNVLEAQSAGDAFLLCEQHAAPIHLLLTDVVMPRMSGRQLAERLAPLRPSMKVLYMSGYTDDAVVRHGILDSTIAFIQKPIMPVPLACKIREVLDAATSPKSC